MKPSAVIFDIDGTLADCEHRRHHLEKQPKDWDAFYGSMERDEPLGMACDIAFALKRSGMRLLFVTGRPERYRKITAEWLDRHVAEMYGVEQLHMRADDDHRPDHELKREIYREKIEPHFDVKLVLEDRASVVKMWRELGLQCWQVAEGNF